MVVYFVNSEDIFKGQLKLIFGKIKIKIQILQQALILKLFKPLRASIIRHWKSQVSNRCFTFQQINGLVSHLNTKS